MLRELTHFAGNLLPVLRLRRRAPSQAALYEEIMEDVDASGFSDERASLVRDLPRGARVLEIGSGTGRMFRHYASDVKLTALEPDPEFASLARTAEARCSVEHVLGNASQLPFEGGSFDAAVCCLVLCSVEDPVAVLREVRRVLRPAGELRLLEHVISDKPFAATLMKVADPAWMALNRQGCRMSRDPIPSLEEAGFAVIANEAFQIFGPHLPAFPMRRLVARA